jgi:hypothetical protein
MTADHRFAPSMLLSLALLATTHVASAQDTSPAWLRVDSIGYPILMFETPTLTAGQCYEIQTTDLQPSSTADTIMSIRTGMLVSDDTITGADDCATPGAGSYQVQRSCVRFCPTVTRTYSIWVRAWETVSRGTTDVRYQQVASATAVPTGSWTTLYDNVSFGGVVFAAAYSAGLHQYETTEQPGAQAAFIPSAHQIVFAGYNGSVLTNWDIQPNGPWSDPLVGSGRYQSHRSAVAGTAQYSARSLSEVAGPTSR